MRSWSGAASACPARVPFRNVAEACALG
jgi:hypothetical protein